MNTDTSKKTFLLVEGALMIAMAFVQTYCMGKAQL